METKEAILATINELSSEDSNSIANDLKSSDLGDSEHNLGNSKDFSANDFSTDSKPNIFIDIKEDVDSLENSGINDEISLLLRLKEKSLVLFEGLRATQNKDMEIKLEMVISYLEYQLYLIEDRLKVLESN